MRIRRLLQLLPRTFGPEGYLQRKGVIFLLSHMRCYSSLLGHLIGSHPMVAGYAEMHQNYRNPLDFLELAHKVEKFGAHPPAGRYLFDKILFPLRVWPNVLRREEVQIIIAVRPPRQTLSSILAGHYGNFDTLEGAGAYYLERLAWLRRAMDQRQGRVLYLDAEALVEQPESTLETLANYLGLTPGFATTYETFPCTGRPKFGDSSPWIRSGRIEPHRGSPQISTRSNYFQAVEKAYQDFRQYALSHGECVIRTDDPTAELETRDLWQPQPGDYPAPRSMAL